MRTSKNDNNSFAPYKKLPEVEAVVEQLMFDFWSARLDKTLEERAFESNPEHFQKLVDVYLQAKRDLDEAKKSLDKS